MSKTLRYVRYTIETLLVNALILSSIYQLVVYIANRRFWRQTVAPDDQAPPISVVVPLQDKGPDTLALLHVLAITGPVSDYEVILVLESTREPVYAVAQEIAASYPAVVHVHVAGPARDRVWAMHAWSAGAQVASGTLIAFIDPNVQMSAELWNVALSAMAAPEVGAVFAPPLAQVPDYLAGSRPAMGGETLPTLHINQVTTAQLPLLALSGRLRGMMNGFILVRRAALDAMGGLLHLLDESGEAVALGRAVREAGYRVTAVPVPARVTLEPESIREGTRHLMRRLVVSRAYHLPSYLIQPFTSPLTVGFLLGFITEREGRWWGRRTWWFFVWLRMALAYELDRLRFGHSLSPMTYAQLFMQETFITPALWAQGLVRRTVTWRRRTMRIAQGGKCWPVE